MYRYDTIDTAMVQERVETFREQVTARLAGDLTEDQFKPLRLMNGVYLQLHAYMLRVAIPYGVLGADQMRMLAHIARHYDRGYGHFTTRQNIQYNWPALVDIPEILEQLASVEMHAIQTSGNTIRNTTTDPFAGAAADEIADPRPWCELIRQWSTDHPEFSFLPRKFKIAVTGSDKDRAAIGVHDIGLRLRTDEAGAIGFEVHVGGGQGRTPRIAVKIRDFLPQTELFAYLTAIMRVYNLNGRRDNLYKARIKILVESLGGEAFAQEVETVFEDLKQDRSLRLDPEEIARVHSFFPEPPAAAATEGRAPDPEEAAGFTRWRKHNVFAHKTEGRALVLISLKPVGGVPGDATDEQMEAVADLAERYALGEIRVTKEQNLVLPHAEEGALLAIFRVLKAAGIGHANANLATDITCCPGLDYCNLANARSIPLSQALSSAIDEAGLAETAGEVTIKISGCINACGHHHVANIGLLGVDKRGEEFYQLTVGGIADGQPAIGKILGPALTAEAAITAITSVLRRYIDLRLKDETFIETLKRLGTDPFKEAAYDR